VTGLELFQIGSYVVPIAAIIYQAGMANQRIRTLETRFDEFMQRCSACKTGLDTEDDNLHGRATALAERVSKIEGQIGGKVAGHD
jgi:hypothetical protein